MEVLCETVSTEKVGAGKGNKILVNAISTQTHEGIILGECGSRGINIHSNKIVRVTVGIVQIKEFQFPDVESARSLLGEVCPPLPLTSVEVPRPNRRAC